MSILKQDIDFELPAYYDECGFEVGKWADFLADRSRPDWRGYQLFRYAVVTKPLFQGAPGALIYHDHMMDCQKSAIRIARHIKEFLRQENKKLCRLTNGAQIKVFDPNCPRIEWA